MPHPQTSWEPAKASEVKMPAESASARSSCQIDRFECICQSGWISEMGANTWKAVIVPRLQAPIRKHSPAMPLLLQGREQAAIGPSLSR